MGALDQEPRLLGDQILQQRNSRRARSRARRGRRAGSRFGRPSGPAGPGRSHRRTRSRTGDGRDHPFLRPFRKHPAHRPACALSRRLQLQRRTIALRRGRAAQLSGRRSGQRTVGRICRFPGRTRRDPQPDLQYLRCQPRRDAGAQSRLAHPLHAALADGFLPPQPDQSWQLLPRLGHRAGGRLAAFLHQMDAADQGFPRSRRARHRGLGSGLYLPDLGLRLYRRARNAA